MLSRTPDPELVEGEVGEGSAPLMPGSGAMLPCGIANTRAIFIPEGLRRKTAAIVYTSALVSIMLVSDILSSRVLEIALDYHVPRSSQS